MSRGSSTICGQRRCAVIERQRRVHAELARLVGRRHHDAARRRVGAGCRRPRACRAARASAAARPRRRTRPCRDGRSAAGCGTADGRPLGVLDDLVDELRPQLRAAGRVPCRGLSRASQPGIASAVASPPDFTISGSSSPWITRVGALMRAQRLGAVARRHDSRELPQEADRVVGAVVGGADQRAQRAPRRAGSRASRSP